MMRQIWLPLEAVVSGSIEKDGLVWGASKLVPSVSVSRSSQINLVVEDDKVGLDELRRRSRSSRTGFSPPMSLPCRSSKLLKRCVMMDSL